ncbi:MAG: alpha/beta fold hydrolase [Verrucomicrobiota bacterium]
MSTLPAFLTEEYPFAQNDIDLHSAARMNYVDDGEGPPVVMLHGNPTWSFFYRNLIKKLTPNRRCIVPDHIGCGLSEKPETYTYRLRQHIDNVVELLESLELESFDLVLHDWGGAIGMGVARRMPDRVRCIVAMNTAAFRAPWIPLRINACKIPWFGHWFIRKFNGFAGSATKMAVKKPLSTEIADGFVYPYGNWDDRIATWAFVKDIPMTPFHTTWDDLVAVERDLGLFKDNPVLLLWGMKDFCFSPKFLKRWIEFFPRADVQVYPDAGHYVLEDAGDDALDRIAKFLENHAWN